MSSTLRRREFLKTGAVSALGSAFLPSSLGEAAVAQEGSAPDVAAQAPPEEKRWSVVIDKAEAEYTVEVGGTMDPENLEITIENLGDAPVVNPRLTVNGHYDWFDVKSIVAEATNGYRTDEEKALALWWWILYKRFQRSPHDESALHPVRGLNGYGYGICGHTAAWMKCLWTTAGLKARVQELWGHTVSEAFYKGAWHLLDGNVKVFYLDHDNHTIAGLATVEHDKSLIERTIHPQDPWFRAPDSPEVNEEMIRYYISYKDNYEEHSYDSEIAKDYTMSMTLKPGEKLVRWWKPELEKFEGLDKRPDTPELYANGQLIWEPDLRRIDIKPYLWIPKDYGNIATQTNDDKCPAIHVLDLQDELYTRPSVFSIPITSPYPIVGGRLFCTLVKEGSSSLDLARIFFGKPAFDSGGVYTFEWHKGAKKVDLDLDSKISESGVIYKYEIGFALRGNASTRPETQAGVDAFRSVTDLQVSPESLPALSLGRNTIHFWHESTGLTKVRITYRWKEIDNRHLPCEVQAAEAPRDGNVVDSLTPTLRWVPTHDPDSSVKIVDYQVLVSLRPDCRWPLSPTLWQNVGSDKAEWKVPATFLNPGTTYYWKVRARSSRGDVGDWGPIFRFQTAQNAR